MGWFSSITRSISHAVRKTVGRAVHIVSHPNRVLNHIPLVGHTLGKSVSFLAKPLVRTLKPITKSVSGIVAPVVGTVSSLGGKAVDVVDQKVSAISNEVKAITNLAHKAEGALGGVLDFIGKPGGMMMIAAVGVGVLFILKK